MPLCYRLVEIGLSLFIGGGEGNPALDPEQLRANPTAFAVLLGFDVPRTGCGEPLYAHGSVMA